MVTLKGTWSTVPPTSATGQGRPPPIYPISIIIHKYNPKALLVSDSFQSFFKKGRKNNCVFVQVNSRLKINRLNINFAKINFEEYKKH